MNTHTVPGLTTTSTTSQVVTTSADTAAEWLTHNTHNRTISEATVRQYASDMTGGRWDFNGQPIIFAADGTLLDGQHRLTAQVRAGVPCTWLVVTGLPTDAQKVIDVGRVRTVANHFQIEGRPQAVYVAALARIDLIAAGENNPSRPRVREHAIANYEEMAAASLTGPIFRLGRRSWRRVSRCDVGRSALRTSGASPSCGFSSASGTTGGLARRSRRLASRRAR
ncbi:hypothetical protein [Actinomyces faecalis]|uniref:hypothetical protein n=1 Tax=Actinomyces faecalis TaxID=2722820 RepID=UPI0015557B64|nr:hypothetical protein [Actinomyces faecalis]